MTGLLEGGLRLVGGLGPRRLVLRGGRPARLVLARLGLVLLRVVGAGARGGRRRDLGLAGILLSHGEKCPSIGDTYRLPAPGR